MNARALFAVVLSMCGAASLAQTTEHQRALAALERAATAVESGRLSFFSDQVREAASSVEQVSDPSDRSRLQEVLQAYEDLRDIWAYSLTTPTGAFFDDRSSDGLFTRLTRHYADFQAFIAPLQVRARDGSIFYPTLETRRFLAQIAAARLAKSRIPPVAQPPPPPPVPAIPAPPEEVCPPPIRIESIVPSARGLLIRSSAPITGSLAAGRQTGEELPAAIPILTVDLPNTTLVGVPARAEWPSGPLESMRATRYRTAEGCGIRLRMQPRIRGNWQIVQTANGLNVTLEMIAETGEAVVAPQEARPGAVSITSSLTNSQDTRARGRSTASGFLAVGFAQGLAAGGTLRGFVSQIAPRRSSGSPFAAIGVSSVPFHDLSLDAAVGDLFVILGDTGEGNLASITSSLFRGAGVAARSSGPFSLQLFGGQAASASLLRLGTEGSYRPAAHDRIIGTQASWIPEEGEIAAATGLLHTAAAGGGPRTLNFFQAVEYRRSPVLRIRLVLEESHAFDSDLNGFAYTVQSHVQARTLTLDGYYRALSSQFRPAGGAGFYAALRRSYGLAASYRLERLSAAASFSQAKTFSILDPESVGTFTTTREANAGYRLSRHFSLQGSYGESSIHSDPGAKIPADSRSRQSGAGVAFGFGKFDALAQLARSETHNEIDPHLDFTSRRVDLDIRSGYGRDIYGRFSLAHSERRDGSAAGSDYRAAIGGPLFEGSRWSVSGEAGVSVIPSGVAQSALRQTYASLRVNPRRSTWLSGGLQFTYERVMTELEKFEVFSTSISMQRMFRWGEGLLFTPPLETRAIRLGERRERPPTSATVHVMIFEDENQNSKLDPGEPPITPAFVDIGGRRYRTNLKGEVTAQVAAGKHTVRLLPRAAVIGYFVPAVSAEVQVAAGETAEAILGLRPAGRLAGRVEPQGDLELALLAGLALRAVGPVERQSFTDASGAFDFGLLPEGEYRVDLVPEPLRQRNLVAIAPTAVTVRVARGGRETVTLRVRKATARERFGP